VTHGYDAIVVGSGPAGSSFARTFADIRPSASILLVEAGPQIADTPGRHVRNIADAEDRARAQHASEGPRRTDVLVDPGAEPVPGQPPNVVRPGTFLISDGMTTSDSRGLPAATMSMNVGGMGAHWTAACPKPGGRERIPQIPSGEMDAALAAADALLGVTQDAFGDAPLAAAIVDALSVEFPRDPDADRPVQPMPLAARRGSDGALEWAGTDGILAPVLRSGSVELRPETLATEVVVEDGRVTGVRLRDLRSQATELVTAPLVFVAGDSFRTPQLLHASGVRPAALGRYLNDHADARTFVQLSERFRDIEGRGGVTWIPYSDDDFPFHCQVMQLDASPIGFNPTGEDWPGSTVGVVLFGTKELRPEDRVEFSDDESDAYGMPALRVSYRLTDRDHETERRLLEMSRRIAGVLGTPLIEPRILPPGGSYHFMGTVRLGDDPETSVCDPTGSVWAVEGLYVGGNGVIPTPTACNPTITSVALAIRSARAAAGAAPA
jgi:choline dehydrogenase-like flavoprotein